MAFFDENGDPLHPNLSLALVLESLSDLCARNEDDAAKRDDVIDQLRVLCPYWKPSDVEQSRKLIDGYLELGRKQNLCKLLSDGKWRFGLGRTYYRVKPSSTAITESVASPSADDLAYKTASSWPREERLKTEEVVAVTARPPIRTTEKCCRCGKFCEAEVVDVKKFNYDLSCLMKVLDDIKEKKAREAVHVQPVLKREVVTRPAPVVVEAGPRTTVATTVKKPQETVVMVKMCLDCGVVTNKEAEAMKKDYTMEELLKLLLDLNKKHLDNKLLKKTAGQKSPEKPHEPPERDLSLPDAIQLESQEKAAGDAAPPASKEPTFEPPPPGQKPETLASGKRRRHKKKKHKKKRDDAE